MRKCASRLDEPAAACRDARAAAETETASAETTPRETRDTTRDHAPPRPPRAINLLQPYAWLALGNGLTRLGHLLAALLLNQCPSECAPRGSPPTRRMAKCDATTGPFAKLASRPRGSSWHRQRGTETPFAVL